jgi:hypothetical protein
MDLGQFGNHPFGLPKFSLTSIRIKIVTISNRIAARLPAALTRTQVTRLAYRQCPVRMNRIIEYMKWTMTNAATLRKPPAKTDATTRARPP